MTQYTLILNNWKWKIVFFYRKSKQKPNLSRQITYVRRKVSVFRLWNVASMKLPFIPITLHQLTVKTDHK